MIFKKKYSYYIFIVIIILQILLYTNNNKKSSFIFFKWTINEVSVGKLISISFFSGLFISTFMNTTFANHKKITLENIDEDYEPPNKNEDFKANVDMPPQRDIRDTQPTISVNYRVVKNTEENNLRTDQNYSNNIEYKDDWNYDDKDW